MRIVITGGAGFIGFHLARWHIARGDEVRLIDNLSKTAGAVDAGFRELARRPRVTTVEADLTDPLANVELPAMVDILYHLAAINGTQLFYERPYDVARTNVLVTVNLLDLLRRRGVRVGRLLYSSTSEVYAGAEPYGLLALPTNEQVPVVFPQPLPVRFSYGTSKFMGEVLCETFGNTHGVPWTILRYHNIYGPRMGNRHVIPELLEKIRARTNPLRILGPQETRAFCYIDDAVEATAAVATTPACERELLHVGNPKEEVTVAELARRMMRQCGETLVLEDGERRDGSVSRRCPDTTKLTRLTGVQPRVSLEEGLVRTIEWYGAHARCDTEATR